MITITDEGLVNDIIQVLEEYLKRHADAIERKDLQRMRNCMEVMNFLRDVTLPSIEGITMDVIYAGGEDDDSLLGA